MDRRKLLVGGGAAALAAGLVAVTGRAATASTTAAPSTADHARLVLDQVNVDLGLVPTPGFQGQFAQNYTALQGSFATGDQDPVVTNDLDVWVRQRMLDLCGTDSYAAAVTEVPQTRTLLAFSFLAYSQDQGTALPQADPTMPVPTMLQTLEPDFLPVLLGQINDKSASSPAFADALQASSAELDRIVAANVQNPPGGDITIGAPNDGGGAGDLARYIYGVTCFILILYWISGRRKSTR
jgi:hypothetical protein